MNSLAFRFQVVTVSAMAVLVGGTFMALAQPKPNEQPPERRPQREAPRGERMPGMLPGGGPQGPFMPFLNRVLTEDQRASLREEMEAQREQTRELEEKLRAARKEMLKASLATRFDADAIRSKALEVGRLDAEMTVLRAQALSKMKPPLSAEQMEKLKNPPMPEAGERPDGPRPESRRDGRPQPERDENGLPPKPRPER